MSKKAIASHANLRLLLQAFAMRLIPKPTRLGAAPSVAGLINGRIY